MLHLVLVKFCPGTQANWTWLFSVAATVIFVIIHDNAAVVVFLAVVAVADNIDDAVAAAAVDDGDDNGTDVTALHHCHNCCRSHCQASSVRHSALHSGDKQVEVANCIRYPVKRSLTSLQRCRVCCTV